MFFQLLGSVVVAYGIRATVEHLTVNYAIRYLRAQTHETMVITGPQMVLTLKLRKFGWNVYDGRRPVQMADLEARPYLPLPSRVLRLCVLLLWHPHRAITTEKLYEGHVKENAKRSLPSGRKHFAYRKMVEGLMLSCWVPSTTLRQF